MSDKIFEHWLAQQRKDVDRLNNSSAVVRIDAVDDTRFHAKFDCRGLVKNEAGDIVEGHAFSLGIIFGPDHLRRFDPGHVIHLFFPFDVFHPNVYRTAICVGRMVPGSGVMELVQQVYSILTYQHMNLRDPLNHEAAAWAREHADQFPIDRRPLIRRLNLVVDESTTSAPEVSAS